MGWIGALAMSLVVVTACMEPETEGGAAPATEETSAAGSDALHEEGVTVVDVTLAESSVNLTADSIRAGTVAFQVRNGGTAEQVFEVKGTGGGGEWKTDPLEPGRSVTMSLNLDAGIYEVSSAAAAGVSNRANAQRTRLRVY